jgi:hypothetical protein
MAGNLRLRKSRQVPIGHAYRCGDRIATGPRLEPRTIAVSGRKVPKRSRSVSTARSIMRDFRAEGGWQQFRQGEAALHLARSSQTWMARSAAPNSRNFCRQPPQGVTSASPAPTTAASVMLATARQDHRRDGAGFGAGAFRIGGVLDIAARMHGTLLILHRRADKEARIRRVGF